MSEERLPAALDEQAPVLASFSTSGSGPSVSVTVHFNPTSLQYTVTNTLKEEGQGSDKKQYVTGSTAKLTMDLVFDTTHTGVDVREDTDKMLKLLQPVGSGKGKQVPPTVKFEWGAYSFTGLVEQYKETIDYFSAGGMPLRSAINLTLSSQKPKFESGRNQAEQRSDGAASSAVAVPTGDTPADSPSGVAQKLGDPEAARAIASANGSASLRFSAGAELVVSAEAGVSLGAAAAFSAGASAGAGFGVGASAGAGFGIGGSAGAGLDIAGAGIGASLGGGGGLSFGASASVSGGAGASFDFGAGASAGVSGTGSFANLRSGTVRASVMPDPQAALGLSVSVAPSTARIGIGGRSLGSTQVGDIAQIDIDAGLDARLKFGA